MKTTSPQNDIWHLLPRHFSQPVQIQYTFFELDATKKACLDALARQNFAAPTRPKNFCLTSHSIFVSIRNRHISSFTGNQFFTFILKKMKVFYARYETLLHTFTSNFVRQVLPKFLPFELWTQNNRFQGVVQNSRLLLLLTDWTRKKQGVLNSIKRSWN